MKRSVPPYGRNDIRVLLGRIESDMSMWAGGHEEISQRLLDHLLHILQKVITLADGTDVEKLQNILHQIERIQSALQRSEPVDHHQAQKLAQQIIEDLREIRHKRTSVLQTVKVEEVVGAYVVNFYYSLSTIGQVVRFQPANRDKKAFGFIGEVVIRPCDEQQAMKDLFQEVYPLRDSPLSNLYHWPADLPPQTFQEPGKPKDLRTIEWANPRHEDEDENEEWEEEAASIDKTIVRAIREGDGDRRIDMPVYSLIHERRGYLKGIGVREDGSELWIVKTDNGKRIIGESDLFWLEIREYHHLFPTRVLSQDDLYQKLREALALNAEEAESYDHDEIIQLHRRLDSIQKFLNGDIEDERSLRIATVYQQMLWNSVSLNESQREEVARQTTTEIDRLRRIQ